MSWHNTCPTASSVRINFILSIPFEYFFKTIRSLKKYFYNDFLNANEFAYLSDIFSKLYSNSSIIEKISYSIIDENTIDDRASKNLASIRKKQRNIEQDIKAKLNTFLHSSTYSKYIQENVITIRNERYVIPVKDEYRGQIKGFVHDVSSSGSTVFIEPIAVFELNNEIANLKNEENLEIERILQDLSKLFYPYANEIKEDIECIGKLDFAFAKAKYSRSINGITPIINTQKQIILKDAKHPLLDPKKAVPISLELGTSFNTLVITGPNTGGKTVTLKTVGLLTAMACSGLNIPAATKSSIYVFDNIFADIGDDQSITESLSTFSAHMKNIVDIVNNSTENSLILVDELGSGTDPVEGASLAISVLDYFKSNSSLTVATTHYQELKKYALTTDGFENASVEFIENEEDLNYETLLHLHQKYQPTQVMIEYNGMWDNTKFVDEICIDQWQVVQILTTISAETFDLYYNNMRGQFVYHVTGSDLVIVNRCDENTKKYPIRGSIKSLNPMCQIVYENKNRQIEDLTVNDLPYNLNDDYIEVNDMDYGIFCMHIMENPQIYENKTIKIKGKVIGRDKLIENGFVLGRQAMVCCSDDMQLLGLVCISKYAKDLIKDEWLVVDGTISLEYDESIQSNIPILHVDHLEGAKPLENEYVTFD